MILSKIPSHILTDMRKPPYGSLIDNAIMVPYQNLDILKVCLPSNPDISRYAKSNNWEYTCSSIIRVRMSTNVKSQQQIWQKNGKQVTTSRNVNLLILLIADSNRSALFGGFRKSSLSTIVSTPAFLRNEALWIIIKPSSTTSSSGAGGGCNPQYRFLGTYKSQFEPLNQIHTA